MIRLEFPKFNIDGLQDKEKLSTIKRQLDTLTNNIQLVLESISGDVETLSEFVGNSNEAENGENISTITETITSITETIGELEDRDYIVEQGTSGIWTYRKWNSGIAECWGWHSTTVTTSEWSAWGNLYETGGSSRAETFPSGLFNAVPIIMVSPPQASNGAFVETTGPGSATNTPNIYIVRPSKVSSTVTFNVPIFARGTWK